MYACWIFGSPEISWMSKIDQHFRQRPLSPITIKTNAQVPTDKPRANRGGIAGHVAAIQLTID